MNDNIFVKLGDVAHECRLTWSGDQTNIPIVGLEHLVPGEIELSSWDSNIEHTFSKKFTKGQVLLGRRRVYLKKAVVAPCDGICSGDITVIESTGGILPELLPFVVQNDRFFDYAMQGSAGSLSPRVKWEHLKNYEFPLPHLTEQKVLADKLWAAYRLKESYKKLLAATEEMVKSQFIEMFGDPINNPKGFPVGTLGLLTKDIIGGECLNGTARKREPGEKAVLKVSAVSWGYFNEDECKVLNEGVKVKKGLYPCKGDLLFCRANTPENIGGTALIDKDYPDLYLPDKIWKIIPKEELTTLYLKYYMSTATIRKQISKMASGTSNSMYNISMEKLKTLPVLIPRLDLQMGFASICHQADKSGFELRKSIEAIDKVIKSLVNVNL